MKPVLFETDYQRILQKVNSIDPIAYGKTRNYVGGAVTYLSPYISRGVISTRQVFESILKRGYSLAEVESFVKELAWRDYFQRVWQEKDINRDIKQVQEKVAHFKTPQSLMGGNTGIIGIDQAITALYETGYMHNHCRMYTASVACNIGQAHWLNPAQWMYYHLLDGDWASNACSWQWVAGSNSGKKYFANQENISKYTRTPMQKSFLDVDYESFEGLPVPSSLIETTLFEAKTALPESADLVLDHTLPTFIFNYYNLDPLWHVGERGNRILLLEPWIFEKYPISQKCIDFMFALAKNIPDLQVFVGNFEALRAKHSNQRILFKEHPLNRHYKGTEESRDWISSQVTGYFPSFFSYWKVLEKELKKIQ